MFKRTLLAAAVAAATTTAVAVPINGTVDFVSGGLVNWSAGQITFPTPSPNGNAIVTSVTGDFVGELESFISNPFGAGTFATFGSPDGSGDYVFDYTPFVSPTLVWSAETISGGNLSFFVDSLDVIDDAGATRVFEGTGYLTDGADNADGSWTFTGNSSLGGSLFSWSSTTSAAASVNEPGTLALVALGVAGLAVRKRIAG